MTPSTIVLDDGLRLANDISAFVDRLYGQTNGRANYRLRLRPDLFNRFARFILKDQRVISVIDAPPRSVMVNGKAVVESR